MRPAALSIAVLLGIATLGGAAQAQATPAVSATIVIESGRTVLVGGKRHDGFHRGGFHRGPSHWHKGFTDHRKHWRAGRPWHGHKALARQHKRWQDGRYDRFHRAPVVIVKPAHGWYGHRHLPRRPLIRHGSFARGPSHW
jgi:hypothetical protein